MQASVGMHSQGTEVEALKQLREILLVFKSGPACGLCCLLAFLIFKLDVGYCSSFPLCVIVTNSPQNLLLNMLTC
jgi:hypothetical protein